MDLSYRKIIIGIALAVVIVLIRQAVGNSNWANMRNTYNYACENVTFKVEPEGLSLFVYVDNRGQKSIALPFYYPAGAPDVPMEKYNSKNGFPLFLTMTDAQGGKTRFVVQGIKAEHSGGIQLKYQRAGMFTVPFTSLTNISEKGDLDFSLPVSKFLANNKGKKFTCEFSMGRGDELDEDGDLRSNVFEIKG